MSLDVMATLNINIKGIVIMSFNSNTLLHSIATSLLLALSIAQVSAEPLNLNEYSKSIYPELVELRRDRPP